MFAHISRDTLRIYKNHIDGVIKLLRDTYERNWPGFDNNDFPIIADFHVKEAVKKVVEDYNPSKIQAIQTEDEMVNMISRITTACHEAALDFCLTARSNEAINLKGRELANALFNNAIKLSGLPDEAFFQKLKTKLEPNSSASQDTHAAESELRQWREYFNKIRATYHPSSMLENLKNVPAKESAIVR